MSSQINWRVAEARDEEIRRLSRGVDVHPLARFVHLAFRDRGRR